MDRFKTHIHPVFTFLVTLFYFGSFCYFINNALHAPFLNWDMLAYVGVIEARVTGDAALLYARMTAEIKQVIPPDTYLQFTQQHALSSQADIFIQQLPFYTIKPLYGLMVLIFQHLGSGLAQATWLVSALSFGLLSICLALWKPVRGSYVVWLLSLWLLCWVGYLPMSALARYSTPDALNLLLVMSAFIAWMRYRCFPVFAVSALLAIATRPDSFLLVCGLCVFFMCFATPGQRMGRLDGSAMIIAVCIAYVAINAILGGYGWEKIFYYNFVFKEPNIAGLTPHITWEQYCAALHRFFIRQMNDSRMIALVCLSAVGIISQYRLHNPDRQWLWLLLGAWVGFALRFSLFPMAESRHYFAFYILMIMANLELISTFVQKWWNNTPPATV